MPDPPTDRLQQDPNEVRQPVNFPGGLSKPGELTASNMPIAPRPRSELTEIRYKKQRGEDLTLDEEAKLAAAAAKYAPCKITIHVRTERKKVWKSLADAQRISLSSWILVMVEKAVRGFDDALRDLRDENQRLRDENGALRGTCGHLSVENGNLQTRIEALETNLTEAMAQALRLAEERA